MHLSNRIQYTTKNFQNHFHHRTKNVFTKYLYCVKQCYIKYIYPRVDMRLLISLYTFSDFILNSLSYFIYKTKVLSNFMLSTKINTLQFIFVKHIYMYLHICMFESSAEWLNVLKLNMQSFVSISM